MTPTRGLALAAVSSLLLATGAACGDDTGQEPTASDPTSATTSASTSSSPSASPTTTESPSATGSPTDSGDPVPSPVVDQAVKAALRADFPALVPAGVPAGWTVVEAAYSGKGGGRWRIALTDPQGRPVQLVQAAQELEAFVAATLGVEAQRAGSVNLGSSGTGRWRVYTGGEVAGDVTAIVAGIARTSAAVIGPDQDTVVELGEQLLTAEDGGSGTGDG